LGLVGGGLLAGFSAAGLPVRALVFGHGLFPSVYMSRPRIPAGTDNAIRGRVR
jgi:hypothetical protein